MTTRLSREFLIRLKLNEKPAYRIAQEAGVNHVTLSRLIHGIEPVKPNDDRISRVASVLCMTAAEAIEDDPEISYNRLEPVRRAAATGSRISSGRSMPKLGQSANPSQDRMTERREGRSLGGNAHRDRTTRALSLPWPRLLSLALAAQYLSVGKRILEDWIYDRILEPVPMPGSILKDKSGNVIARAKNRRIAKILIDREDLDQLIIERKEAICTSPSRAVTCGHCGATAGTCGHHIKPGCGNLRQLP
jgi:hypothetical protein